MADLAREKDHPSVSELAVRSGFRGKVMVLTHSHPQLTKGGAEVAANSLANSLRADFGFDVSLVGCSRKLQTSRLGVPITQPFGQDDYVYQAHDNFSWFNFACRDDQFVRHFEKLLLDRKPEVLHFHHYAFFGVDIFGVVKRVLPKSKIVLTLHEFLAICNNMGQMVKRDTLMLCKRENQIDCAACFPELGAHDFFLRKDYILKNFRAVDAFVSPSRFLANRYIEWGLDPSKISVIENVTSVQPQIQSPVRFLDGSERVDASHSAASALAGYWPTSSSDKVVRIGFFGQLSPLKGIDVLLEAARILAKRNVESIKIEIHGSYANQPPEFQEKVKKGLLRASKNVQFYGPFDNVDVLGLMSAVDAVVVPSIWWENSPVVIEESLAAGRPVICSNIGGMAEKVRHGIDGIHFTVGDSQSLASVLEEIAEGPQVLKILARTARRPAAPAATTAAHINLYESLFT